MLVPAGVMRFLQIEWHNHERARNAWDIERAEMKAKIAKQEGELRHTKKLSEQLDRQIRMLEAALKNERAKSRTKPGQDASLDSEAARKDAKPPTGSTLQTKAEQAETKCEPTEILLLVVVVV